VVDTSDVPAFIRFNGRIAESFEGLVSIAKRELATYGGKAEVVCGPITSGGWGDTVVNLLVFEHAIRVLERFGRPVWSQMPFEAGLAELEARWRKDTGETGYCHPILTEFYQPLFDATPRLFSRAWFIDGERGWRTSRGAQWEHQKMLERGIAISYFPHEWHCNTPEVPQA
jgi:hypothetical protein